ncbi:ABC transporter permease [Acrocarpospora catenulata]|uniref:ABC transporter permease n=1 Tax=Acrocarpospora catenulata TaxID=2836182 RepID=UPI001BD93ABD|nr:FtsX-like permease family protein [Acrocarpospora catenulata]
MTALWFRLELHRRWRSLVALALLVAFAVATVLAAVAGARRGAGAYDRLRAGTLPADVVVLPNQPGFDWDRIRALPEVAAVATFVVGDFRLETQVEGVYANFPPGDAEVFRTVERPVVLAGRVFDPARLDEVVVSPGYLERTGQRLGDRVAFTLWRPEQRDQVYNVGDQPPAGPRIEARVVGVIRSPWFTDPTGQGAFVVISPAVFAKYPGNLLGKPAVGYVNALVRLNGGAGAIRAFKESLVKTTGRTDIDVWRREDNDRQITRVLGFEAASLLAFALAGCVAAIVLVGQAVSRYATATVTELDSLRATGLTRRQTVALATLGPTSAAGAGAVLGVAAAAAASPGFPIGTAAYYEPTPGFAVDPVVLLLGGLAAVALVAAGAAATTWFALHRSPWPRPSRSAVTAAAARLGLPIPVVVGTRFALEPGRGRHAVPIRPALAGAITGVLGVLAAFTFSNGVGDAATNPARYGQTYQLTGFFGLNGETHAPVDKIVPAIEADQDVVAFTETKVAVAQAGRDISVSLYGFRSRARPVEQIIMAGGMPDAPDQVLLGVSTARRLGLSVGDTLPLDGERGRLPYRVSGLGFVPAGSHNSYDDGGILTQEGYDRLFGTFKYHLGLIGLRPGTDPEAALSRLSAAVAAVPGGEQAAFEVPAPPEQLGLIQRVRVLPLLLAAFLALLAVGAVGHALATAVRRRAHEVAILRALGMTRPQARLIVLVQATVLALVGVLVGLPLGLALGRVLWRVVADTTPLAYQPPLALWALLLTAPVALLTANLLATWPGRRYARLQVTAVLRAE